MSIPLAVPDRVVLTCGTGRGETELTAFDSALYDAGVHNANIVEVSSLIPPGADLTTDADRDELVDSIEIGGLHPMVVAKETASSDGREPGDRLVAAIGAGRLDDRYGVNVEAHGVGNSTESIRERCRQMLSELADTRDAGLERTTSVVSEEYVPETGAVAAVAAAVYL